MNCVVLPDPVEHSCYALSSNRSHLEDLEGAEFLGQFGAATMRVVLTMGS